MAGARRTTARFRRRYYARPGPLLRDARALLERRALVRRAMRGYVAPGFRERLMMIVTEVNGCRYCSYYHACESLAAGVPESELRELLAGSIPSDAPADELPALLYARHWAETDARPDPEADRRLTEVYGGEKAEAIRVVLRMIRVGNLLGNSADYLLYRLTLGRFGLRADEARFGG